MPSSVTNPKSSDPDYICNPTTNRWVKLTGKIGKDMLTHFFLLLLTGLTTGHRSMFFYRVSTMG